MSSHSPVGEIPRRPVPTRLILSAQVTSDRRYTRWTSADHCARSQPVQPCADTGRCCPLASMVSRVMTAPFCNVATSTAELTLVGETQTVDGGEVGVAAAAVVAGTAGLQQPIQASHRGTS